LIRIELDQVHKEKSDFQDEDNAERVQWSVW